jgi:hypothetical protein
MEEEEAKNNSSLHQQLLSNSDKFKLNSSDISNNSSAHKPDYPEMPAQHIKWFVQHAFGLFTVLIVYLFFAKIYFVTLLYAILPFDSPVLDTINIVMLTSLTLISMYAHFLSMT